MYPIYNVSSYPNYRNWSPGELEENQIRERLEPFDIAAVVYEYFAECYEANGKLIAVLGNGATQEYDLGHCSCYGPTDDLGSGERIDSTLSRLLEPSDSIHDSYMSAAMLAKLREIAEAGVVANKKERAGNAGNE